ncbi:hypothetical protein CLAFUW4_05266 [Fulvia fulva]|uniref:uncharacterized protein n=1 Tax=Passalora fulva TaxID=5499 RepID=UPI0004E9E090|nr:uncharacterized protein CLAFUR5_20197 [Fulvia fulva]KAK4624264.1 hypothetical protein CLAFUR4_05260 [Fulvia fulva]KAK4624868.1 hypothetical protein CLAFUR0_05267 [Fulvia fulva]WMI38887.1 hypothetical protein CLAFUR5_20197 [Fulvia fulva]WPV14519.1 hypothetical protein CLAFUW4_05266 [Fulvia fulva]WPV29396.1 hypothetical protein CLAFUW7_05265 [Fulvia fulva]
MLLQSIGATDTNDEEMFVIPSIEPKDDRPCFSLNPNAARVIDGMSVRSRDGFGGREEAFISDFLLFTRAVMHEQDRHHKAQLGRGALDFDSDVNMIDADEYAFAIDEVDVEEQEALLAQFKKNTEHNEQKP